MSQDPLKLALDDVNYPLRKLKQAVSGGSAGDVIKAAQLYLAALDTNYYYRESGKFTDNEKQVIRICFNRVEPDELCEYLGCSMQQLVDAARLNHATNQRETITAQDMALMERCLKQGKTPAEVCQWFEIEEPPTPVYINNEMRREITDALVKDAQQIKMKFEDE